MLHSDEDHKLPFKPYVFLAVAKQMLIDIEQVESIIQYCIHPCELLKSDEEFFWSERVIRNIKNREDIREKKSRAGKASAEARKTSRLTSKDLTGVEQPSTGVEHNPTQSNKGKERKVKGKGNNIEERSQAFTSEVMTFKGKYSPDTLNKFLNYWTEKNKNGTKMKWEMQETFEISKRLGTWYSREMKFDSTKDGVLSDQGFIAKGSSPSPR